MRKIKELHQKALKWKTKGEFQKGDPNSYQAIYRRGLIDDLCSHMPKHVDISGKNHPRFRHTIKNIKKIALKHKTVSSFFKKDSNTYYAASRLGILNAICKHMKRKCSKPLTEKQIQKRAKNYNNRTYFAKKDKVAYNAAIKLGILDEVCFHMTLKLNYFSNEEILKESKKYNTLMDFYKNSPKHYRAGLRLGLMDQIYPNMKQSCGTSLPEQELFNIIKQYHSTTKKTKDRKVNIPNKPHIKGFDIDIFIPELNKGVEFDGTYYHSYEFMKTSIGKSNWPNEDILNYHQIKDDYFASKGIKILHIKEEDWIKNKDKCIKICLNFLNK